MMENDGYIISEVIFYSGKRWKLPKAGYQPDAVFEGYQPKDAWRIIFEDLSVSRFDKRVSAEMKFAPQNNFYHKLEEGQAFKIMEGPLQVGEGKVLRIREGTKTE